MATETKRLLSRDDIRTMRKDIQILKKGGVLNQSEKNSNKEQSKKEVEVETKSVEQNVQNLSNQVKVDVVEKKSEQKSEFNLSQDIKSQDIKKEDSKNENPLPSSKASYINVDFGKKKKFIEDVEEFINLS